MTISAALTGRDVDQPIDSDTDMVRGRNPALSKRSQQMLPHRASSPTETTRGRKRSIWSASTSMFEPAPSAATSNSSPNASITRSVLQPIDPVDPRMDTFFAVERF
jgi:hypothetical protein